MKRKANNLPSKTFNESEWQYCKECFMRDDGLPSTLNATAKTPYTAHEYGSSVPSFDESKGDTLVISNISQSFSGTSSGQLLAHLALSAARTIQLVP